MRLPIVVVNEPEHYLYYQDLDTYRLASCRLTLFYNPHTKMVYRNRTLVNMLGFIYWIEKNAFVIHKNGVEIKCNKKYKKQFNWTKGFLQAFPMYNIEWVNDEYFDKFVLNINEVKFKNIKQQKQTLSNFGVWLQNLKNSNNTQNQQA